MLSVVVRRERNYRGPVREVRIEQQRMKGPHIRECRLRPDGTLATATITNPDGRGVYVYDQACELIDPSRTVRIIGSRDGARREIERIPLSKYASWGRIHGYTAVFSTWEASQVEAAYDARGLPVEVVFKRDNGEVVSKVEFLFDERGNFHEILRYDGAGRANPLPAEKHHPPCMPGLALGMRETYDYDEAGHTIEHVTYMRDHPPNRTVWTYNEHGDVATTTEANGRVSRYEHYYDEHGNWTREVWTCEAHTLETIRKIVYDWDPAAH